jgi:hypothetical protein
LEISFFVELIYNELAEIVRYKQKKRLHQLKIIDKGVIPMNKGIFTVLSILLIVTVFSFVDHLQSNNKAFANEVNEIEGRIVEVGDHNIVILKKSELAPTKLKKEKFKIIGESHSFIEGQRIVALTGSNPQTIDGHTIKLISTQ